MALSVKLSEFADAVSKGVLKEITQFQVHKIQMPDQMNATLNSQNVD
jgi:hypothetical protein